jgi:hypothetical protein
MNEYEKTQGCRSSWSFRRGEPEQPSRRINPSVRSIALQSSCSARCREYPPGRLPDPGLRPMAGPDPRETGPGLDGRADQGVFRRPVWRASSEPPRTGLNNWSTSSADPVRCGRVIWCAPSTVKSQRTLFSSASAEGTPTPLQLRMVYGGWKTAEEKNNPGRGRKSSVVNPDHSDKSSQSS